MNPTPSRLLQSWLSLLNRESNDFELLHPESVLRFYPAGRGSEPSEMRGRDALMQWMLRGPHRYVYRATQASPAVPEPSLAALHEPCSSAQGAFACRYTVSLIRGRWSNSGDWLFHWCGEALVAVLHIPDPLRDDDVDFDFDEPLVCSGLEHEHEEHDESAS
ncbi:MAG: hypothetical protein RBU37_26890 [Myxococcota bacterium]|jgi:hypothetical protein|nr:hypothetical protein [Myxococcota bacterium]